MIRMRKQRRWARLTAAVCLMGLLLGTTASAEVPYDGYVYNEWGRPENTPNGYLAEQALTGNELGVGDFKGPRDMFVDAKGELYILDSGNKRIVVLSQALEPVRVIDSFPGADLQDPNGLFVNGDGEIFIADKAAQKIFVTDSAGKLKREVLRPSSDVIQDDFAFAPVKVVEDSSKNLYVLSAGTYQGAIQYDMDGRFTGFYGSNKITGTAAVMMDIFWKRFLTKEQRDKMKRYIPIEYNNFDIDDEDFIYTCTSVTDNSKDEIKKLNPTGVNILKARGSAKGAGGVDFGDLETTMVKGQKVDTTFVDVHVDGEDYIYGLDSARGRVFQYDQEANLIFSFGGIGQQKGLFSAPCAVETLGGKVLVLDTVKNNLTVFGVTEFGQRVHTAVQLYNQGLYDEAVQPWREVLELSENYRLAYIGIGKALYNAERYEEAMAYFKLGFDKKGYSDAYKEYRTQYMRSHFTLIVACLVLLCFLPRILRLVRAPLGRAIGRAWDKVRGKMRAREKVTG